MTERRLTAERLQIITDWSRSDPDSATKALLRELLREHDAVRAERDEALKQLEILRKQHGVGLAGMNFITNRERGAK